MTTKTPTQPSILAQLAEIQALSLPELRERWTTLFGTSPPGYSREHLIRRLAYRVQELQFGGLNDATRSKLGAAAEADGIVRPDGAVSRLSRRTAKPCALVAGTVLRRTWHGELHLVTVLADGGFEYEGQRYRSLSAVARVISGQIWGGPLFFGLRARGRKEG